MVILGYYLIIGYDEDDIVEIGKYMVENDIYSSQEFTEADFEKLNITDEDLKTYLLDEGIWIDSTLADTLQQYNNCILIRWWRRTMFKRNRNIL